MARGAAQSLPSEFTLPDAPGTIPPERSFSLLFRPDQRGTVTVRVDALDRGAMVLATAMADAMVEPSRVGKVRVVLPGSTSTDAGADGSFLDDLSVFDFSAMDFSTVVDV